MSRRLSRAEQTDRNRAELFAAARRVFLARGYHAATLEQIADEAGFSKGVVYSRFASKADMFLALLELVRLQAILLNQDRNFSEIFIKKHTEFDSVINEISTRAQDDWR